MPSNGDNSISTINQLNTKHVFSCHNTFLTTSHALKDKSLPIIIEARKGIVTIIPLGGEKGIAMALIREGRSSKERPQGESRKARFPIFDGIDKIGPEA